jgi:hypothetical protein
MLLPIINNNNAASFVIVALVAIVAVVGGDDPSTATPVANPDVFECWNGSDSVKCPAWVTMAWTKQPPVSPTQGVSFNLQFNFKFDPVALTFIPQPKLDHGNVHACPAELISCPPPFSHPLRTDTPPATATLFTSELDLTNDLTLAPGDWLVLAHVRVKDATNRSLGIEATLTRKVSVAAPDGTTTDLSKDQQLALREIQILPIVYGMFCLGALGFIAYLVWNRIRHEQIISNYTNPGISSFDYHNPNNPAEKDGTNRGVGGGRNGNGIGNGNNNSPSITASVIKRRILTTTRAELFQVFCIVGAACGVAAWAGYLVESCLTSYIYPERKLDIREEKVLTLPVFVVCAMTDIGYTQHVNAEAYDNIFGIAKVWGLGLGLWVLV